ncbi:MAG: hypothetical protein HY646_16070, partial [Acidobacteria bacterium]|nr:hypothetical protein [Acidobacteriota bacterium]
MSVRVATAAQAKQHGLRRHLMLIGNPESNSLIADVYGTARLSEIPEFPNRYHQMTGVTVADLGDGFSIRTRRNPHDENKVVVLLEGRDRLGMQYASYDYAEQALGVRYLSPYFDYIPAVARIPVSHINLVETPDFPLRRLEVWNFQSEDVRDPTRRRTLGRVNRRYAAETNDPQLWYFNALGGDVTMMKRCVDWLVKNKQNVITWLHEHFLHRPSITPGEYAEHEAMRGLKILAYISPGSNHLPPDLHNRMKNPNDALAQHSCRAANGESFFHLCYKSDAYWKMLEEELDWYEKPENAIRQVVGYSLYYGEGSCSYPGYCIADHTKRRCVRCGKIPNWKKWVHTMRVIEERIRSRGRNVPVGLVDFGCASSGVPRDDDPRFGVRPQWDTIIVDHVPSPNNYFELRPAGDHTWEEMGHYWDYVKNRNRREGTRLSIFKQGESILGMSTDLPLISPYYFETRDHDFSRLAGDDVTLGHDTNLFTTHHLEWLKTYHVFQSQWKFQTGWRAFLEKEIDHLFGDRVGADFIRSLDLFLRVLKQELLWQQTPHNHNANDWRGVQARFGYLIDIFINLQTYPSTGEGCTRDGHYYTFPVGRPLRYRTRFRPFARFVEKEVDQVVEETSHYRQLLQQSEK